MSIKIKTSSPAGDLISYLAGIRQLCKETGQQAAIYQQLNVIGVGLPGVSQPFQNEQGESILMNEEMFQNLKPLIMVQEYVESFEEYTGQEIDLDMDRLRLEVFTGQPYGSLNRYSFYGFPQMACDLSKAWLTLPDERDRLIPQDMILINHTNRYRNNFINYFFLKKHTKNMLFIGLEEEHKIFTKQWDVDIPRFLCGDFLDLAVLIKKSKFLLSNASMCFQLAEALKVPRILETFQLIPNVIPIGKDAYDYYSQSALEFYFNKLINK